MWPRIGKVWLFLGRVVYHFIKPVRSFLVSGIYRKLVYAWALYFFYIHLQSDVYRGYAPLFGWLFPRSPWLAYGVYVSLLFCLTVLLVYLAFVLADLYFLLNLAIERVYLLFSGEFRCPYCLGQLWATWGLPWLDFANKNDRLLDWNKLREGEYTIAVHLLNSAGARRAADFNLIPFGNDFLSAGFRKVRPRR